MTVTAPPYLPPYRPRFERPYFVTHEAVTMFLETIYAEPIPRHALNAIIAGLQAPVRSSRKGERRTNHHCATTLRGRTVAFVAVVLDPTEEEHAAQRARGYAGAWPRVIAVYPEKAAADGE